MDSIPPVTSAEMGRKLKTENPSVNKHVTLEPKTPAQARFIAAIEGHPISMGIGPAGTGKTFVSSSIAARGLVNRQYDKIVLSRANVPTGRSLGHFPGTVEDKLTPWLTPALDILRYQMGETMFKYCMAKKVIQLQPLETIRGRSFESTFMIVDESQNLNKDEITSITTRLGEYSKLVLLGDPFQTDIKGENGLEWFENLVIKYGLNIPVTRFGLEDVVRSKIVKQILVALYAEHARKSKLESTA